PALPRKRPGEAVDLRHRVFGHQPGQGSFLGSGQELKAPRAAGRFAYIGGDAARIRIVVAESLCEFGAQLAPCSYDQYGWLLQMQFNVFGAKLNKFVIYLSLVRQ